MFIEVPTQFDVFGLYYLSMSMSAGPFFHFSTSSQNQLQAKKPFSTVSQVYSRSGTVQGRHENVHEKTKADLASTGAGSPVSWLLETLAAILSLACMAGLVIFLHTIDGKPYSSWHIISVDVTPNTLLSLLSTLCRACFLLCVAEGLSQLKWDYFRQRERRLVDLQHFDAASRGQLGALRLLWSLNYRALLASSGAVVTVLAIATDPLTNQILTVRTRLTNVANSTASIGAAYAFGLQAQNAFASVSQPLSDAMVRGIYAPSLQVNYNCASGYCAWPSFDSLGFCSSCKEVSDEVQVQCGECELNKRVPGTTDYYSTAICNYTTPGGVNASVQLQSNERGTVSPDTFLETMIWDLGSMAGNASNRLNLAMDGGGRIATLSALRFDQTYSTQGRSFADYVCGHGANTSWPMIRPKAYSCTLGWCVHSFQQTRFQDGGLVDEASYSQQLKIASDHCFVPANRQGPGNKLLCPTYPADEAAPQADTLTNASAPLKDAHVYWINDVVTTNVQAYLDDTFDFSIGGDRPANNRNNGNNLATSPALQQTFYTANGGNVSQTMQDLARSMTNEVRQGPESVVVPGTVAYPVTYLQVRWPWLVYLGSLCFLAVVFLLAVVVVSCRQHTPAWKSSSLALLFHGVGNDIFGGRDISSLRNMETIARDVRGQLGEDNIVHYSMAENGGHVRS